MRSYFTTNLEPTKPRTIVWNLWNYEWNHIFSIYFVIFVRYLIVVMKFQIKHKQDFSISLMLLLFLVFGSVLFCSVKMEFCQVDVLYIHTKSWIEGQWWILVSGDSGVTIQRERSRVEQRGMDCSGLAGALLRCESSLILENLRMERKMSQQLNTHICFLGLWGFGGSVVQCSPRT